MRRQLLPALLAFLAFTVALGIVYPLIVTGISQVAFPGRADGSLVERDGEVVGSSLIGRLWDGDRYFQPRASAAGDGYDPQSSSASNLGPIQSRPAPGGRGARPRPTASRTPSSASCRSTPSRPPVRPRPAHLARERPPPGASRREGPRASS